MDIVHWMVNIFYGCSLAVTSSGHGCFIVFVRVLLCREHPRTQQAVVLVLNVPETGP